MRVLWFTNTPSLAEEKGKHKPIGGGWIKSLEKEIAKNNDIQLGIVFYSYKKINPFQHKQTNYYPIFLNTGGRLKKIFHRIRGAIEPSTDVRQFIDVINDFNPNVIHIHGTEGPFGLIQNYIKHIPILVSIQGNITVYKYKYFSGLSWYNVFRYSNLKDLLLFKDYISQYRAFINRAKREKEILSLTKNVIGRTDWDRRITSVLAPGRRYFHNDEVLRDSFYKNIWRNKLSKPFQFFTTNGSSLYKGIEVVIYAAKLLDDIGFQFNWQVAGISQNDKIIRLILKKFKISLSVNLVFDGKLNEMGLIQKLLSTHVYIMPSHIENSPNNLFEAMILGIPCIGSDVGGTSSLLANNEDGLLIQDGDPWSLAGAILESYSNYDDAIVFGQNARKKALTRHDPFKIVNDLIKIYKKILANDK